MRLRDFEVRFLGTAMAGPLFLLPGLAQQLVETGEGPVRPGRRRRTPQTPAPSSERSLPDRPPTLAAASAKRARESPKSRARSPGCRQRTRPAPCLRDRVRCPLPECARDSAPARAELPPAPRPDGRSAPRTRRRSDPARREGRPGRADAGRAGSLRVPDPSTRGGASHRPPRRRRPAPAATSRRPTPARSGAGFRRPRRVGSRSRPKPASRRRKPLKPMPNRQLGDRPSVRASHRGCQADGRG